MKTVGVYRVNLPDVEINRWEYRNELSLQHESHSLISVRYPHTLNSAPGGYLHDFRVDRYPPRPLPEVARDANINADVATAVDRHLSGCNSWFAEQPGGSPIAPHSLVGQIQTATPSFSFEGRTPMVAFGKDVTREEFDGVHVERGYRDWLAGLGPQATKRALLHQYGVDVSVATTEERRRLLPPFSDLYLAPVHTWEIGLFLSVHRWPVVLWVESAEVTWALLEDALAKIKFQTSRTRFLNNEVHDPSGSCVVKKNFAKMHENAGAAFLTNLGDGHYAVVLVNYDRGMVKYDPELAQDRWELQQAVDAAHQARTVAYFEFIAVHRILASRQQVERMHDRGAVPPTSDATCSHFGGALPSARSS